MQPRSQAELEHELEKRWAQVQDGKLSPQQAFGTMDEWIIQLGQRKVFLHPDLKQWMWYDRLHDEWVFAGCGVGEAILMAIGSMGGVKKLPQPGDVDGWCIYRQDQKLAGPLRIEELRKGLETQRIPNDILIWSTLAADWLSVGDDQWSEWAKPVVRDTNSDRELNS
jgi:hypothetical protein